MKCERARELFSEYLEGSIDYALTATVRTHVDQCDVCREDLRAFQCTWDAMSALPEIEPPASFRHDVVMRAARLQHERRSEQRRGLFGLDWNYSIGRLLPTRALAVAAAGAVLAAVLINLVPRIAPLLDENNRRISGFSPLLPAGAEQRYAKEEWQSRKILSNALWASIRSTDLGEGRSYYELVLEINNKALVRRVTNRIAADVYVLPPGRFGVASADQRAPVWSGNVLGSSPVHVAVPGISNSKGDPMPVTLLINYRFEKISFAKIVFVPTDSSPAGCTDPFVSFTGPVIRPMQNDLYAVLQGVSQSKGLAIIANGTLHKQPTPMSIISGTTEDVLRTMLTPLDLTWAVIDGAVYVDKEFRVEAE
ncbi:MAG: zf-HC2 domain-containing protein [Armatimonadetes bacterium]|nr:zf-HC2 domain-containing protein [Armatimonadota bacterium]